MTKNTSLVVIEWLAITLGKIADAIATVRKSYPAWEQSNDARWFWFPGAKKVLILTQLHIELRMVYLGDSNWWSSLHPDFNPKDIPDILHETEVLYKWWTLHQPYAQFEEALRRIAEAFEPGSIGPAQSISSISRNLCTKLGLDKYVSLFDLAHTVRNTMHNNGVFRPLNSQPKQIIWNGKTYEFLPDRNLNFVSWEFACEHLGDLSQGMLDIVSHPKITSLSDVKRL